MRLEAVVEVESVAAALDLVVRGVGDTVASISLIEDLGLGDRLHWVSLDPPLFERYAFITRRGAKASPAMTALVDIVGGQLGLELEDPAPL